MSERGRGSPSSSSRGRTTTATRRGRCTRSAPTPCSSGTRTASSPTSAASSFPAGSRTATTSAAARSPASRRRWPPSAASPDEGGPVLGICNGFQILCEAGLLPGVLRPNRSLEFVCRDVRVRVERADTPFTSRCAEGQTLAIPVKHGEGCWYADDELYAELLDLDQIVLRYEDNPNGSVHDVAGRLQPRGQRARADAPPRARRRPAARPGRRRFDPGVARRRGARARVGRRLGLTSESERLGELGVLLERAVQLRQVARPAASPGPGGPCRRSCTRSGRAARPCRPRAAARPRRTASRRRAAGGRARRRRSRRPKVLPARAWGMRRPYRANSHACVTCLCRM